MTRYVSIGIALLVALIFVGCGANTVDTGHRGVKVRFGEVVGEPLTSGLYFVNPFTTSIKEINVQTLKWEGHTAAYTKDVQQANVKFTLNYALDPAHAHTVYRDVGEEWVDKLVGQGVWEEIKREFGQHNAVDVVSSRDVVARKIEANVVKILAQQHVLVSSFRLTNIDYTKEFEHAVEAKVIAQQKAIEEKNRTVQIEEQAAQQIATAEGNAKATILNAKAEAESISIRARALEQNAKLVEWEAVQKWNGQLPTYMLGSGATPFIQVPNSR
jgi:regulator of protease activity HflC (stomatin/prohibitin superfamily)